MQEEADLNVGQAWGRDVVRLDTLKYPLELDARRLADVLWAVDEGAEKHGEEHKMIVLDPDHGAGRELLHDDLGKGHISLSIR